MSYSSIFERVSDYEAQQENQEFHGTLDEIMRNTEDAIEKDNPIRKLLFTPRIVRTYIDHNIRSGNSEDLVAQSIDLALNIYSGSDDAKEKLKELIDDTIGQGLEEIFVKKTIQEKDSISWTASRPEYSEDTARYLNDQVGGRPILFVALAHGGTAPGMDVFLRYKDMTETDSAFYTVRFSRLKHGDRIPRLSGYEVEHLREDSEGRNIVIFDEDRSSGETLDSAEGFFRDILPEKEIMTAENDDGRHKASLMKMQDIYSKLLDDYY